jgi:hypothetical protein
VFAAYEFQASKSELYQILNDSVLNAKVLHRDTGSRDTDLGEV